MGPIATENQFPDRALVACVKGTVVGKNKIYDRENRVGPFLVHTISGPRPPPSLLMMASVQDMGHAHEAQGPGHGVADAACDGRGPAGGAAPKTVHCST